MTAQASGRALPKPQVDLLHLPGLGRLLRWRWGRLLFQVPLLALAALMIYDGLTGPRQLHFYVMINGRLRHIRADNVLDAGVFHHVAGTYDGRVMRLYLDGVQVGRLAVSGKVGRGSDVELSSSSETLNGLLDEVGIYDRALSAAEIQGIFDACSAK